MKKFESLSQSFYRSDLCILIIHGGYTIISLEEKSHIRDAMGKKGIKFDTVVSNGNDVMKNNISKCFYQHRGVHYDEQIHDDSAFGWKWSDAGNG